MEYQVRQLRLPRGHSCGFCGERLWSDYTQSANLLHAHPRGTAIGEPCYSVCNSNPTLELVWIYARRFSCEQVFRNQKLDLFQLESRGLRDLERIDRLLVLVVIAVLLSSLQGYAVTINCLRHQMDPHWRRGMYLVRSGLVCCLGDLLAKSLELLLD